MKPRFFRRHLPQFTALAALTATVVVVAPARAQQGAAVLTGKVVDASNKKGVVDVVVTVTSPALQGEQIVTTDKTGTYRIPSLPPGVYTLHLDKEGFRAYERKEIQLRADATIRLDADLLPEGLTADVVVVTAHTPTVDVGSTTTGSNIDAEFASRVPVTNPGARGGAQRTFESVAEAAPGATADRYGTSIMGTTSPENSYVIDGMRTNSSRYGLNGSPLSIEFVKEVNVLSGGYMPEYGKATGGILNVVTKSGSNEYHGNVWANWTPGSLEGARKYPTFQGTTFQTRRSLGNVYDVGFDQSGPIVKDKLWYYVGFGLSRAVYNLDRSLWQYDGARTNQQTGAIDPNSGSEIPGTNQQFKATATSYQIFAKLDYRINQDNKLALSFAATPTTSGGGGDFSVSPSSGQVEGALQELNIDGTYGRLAHVRRSGAYDTILKWTSEFDNKSKNIETIVGWHHEVGGSLPADGFGVGSGLGYSALPSATYRRNPLYHDVSEFERVPAGTCGFTEISGGRRQANCPVVQYRTGGPGFIDQQVLDSYALKSVLTVLAQGAGHHVIKAGAELELATSWASRGSSGGRTFTESSGGTRYDSGGSYGYLTAPDQPVLWDRLVTRSHSFSVGGFIQDSWSIMDKVTLNVGLRYDNQFLFSTDGKLFMTLPNQISPRVGIIYDPFQNGRSKIFVSYAKFYQSVPLNLMDRGVEPRAEKSLSLGQCNPLNPGSATGDCMNNTRVWPAVGGRQGISNIPDRAYAPYGGGKTIVDPDLSPQSMSELSGGGEYEIIKNGRIGMSYVRRWMNNVIEDMSNDEAATFFIGNPGKGIAKGFPEAERNYDAGTVYFMKTFADSWLAQVSYTLSWLRGNIAGLYKPDTGQLDPNANSTFDLKSILVNQTGDLPGDRRHAIKLYAAKDFHITKESHLDIGGSIQVRSGGPTNVLGAHPLYGADEVYILPRGTGDRLPWNGNFGTHVGYGWKFENGMSLQFTCDIFNLLNLQGGLSTDERYTRNEVFAVSGGSKGDLPGNVKQVAGGTLPAGAVNPNFGNTNLYQEPRQFRFGIRGSF